MWEPQCDDATQYIYCKLELHREASGQFWLASRKTFDARSTRAGALQRIVCHVARLLNPKKDVPRSVVVRGMGEESLVSVC